MSRERSVEISISSAAGLLFIVYLVAYDFSHGCSLRFSAEAKCSKTAFAVTRTFLRGD